MLVVPAIDLRGGKCVRMKQGDPTTEIAYDDDPVERAKEFVTPARGGCTSSISTEPSAPAKTSPRCERICEAVDVPVQTGGGLRAVKHAENAFAAGAAEIILGTLFVEDERLARHIISRFPGKVIAGDRRARHAGRDARLAGAHARRPRRARSARRAVGRSANHLHGDPARRHGRGLRHRRAQRGRERRRGEGDRQRRRAQHRRLEDAQSNPFR